MLPNEITQRDRGHDARCQRQQHKVSHPRPHIRQAKALPQQHHGDDDLREHAKTGAPARRLPSEIRQRHRAGGERDQRRYQRDQGIGPRPAIGQKIIREHVRGAAQHSRDRQHHQQPLRLDGDFFPVQA